MRPILIGTILQLVTSSDQENDCASLGFDEQGNLWNEWIYFFCLFSFGMQYLQRTFGFWTRWNQGRLLEVLQKVRWTNCDLQGLYCFAYNKFSNWIYSLRNLKFAPENWADFPKYRPSWITTRKISKISKSNTPKELLQG